MATLLSPMEMVVLPLLVVVLCATVTHCYFRWARERLLDIPGSRSSHKVPTPSGGGVGFVVATLSVLLWFQPEGWLQVLVTSLMVAAISFRDDVSPLHHLPRIVVQASAALLLILWMPDWPSLAPMTRLEDSDLFIGFLLLAFLMWSINLYNFMDGIDGLAASQGIFVSLVMAALLAIDSQWAWASVYLALSLGLLVFLKWNWSPARMFMGDTGSVFLGWWFAASGLMIAANTNVNIWMVLITVSVFVTDASFTLFRRWVQGEQIFNAHRSHVYQILTERLDSHSSTVKVYLLVNGVLVLPTLALAWSSPQYSAEYCIVLYLILLSLCVGAWGGFRVVASAGTDSRVGQLALRRFPVIWIMALDGLASMVSFSLAYLIRLDFPRFVEWLTYEWLLAPLVALITAYAFYRVGVYRIAVKHMLNKDLGLLVMAALLSAIALATVGFMTQAVLPRSVPIVYFVILLALVGGSRVLVRAMWRARLMPDQASALIINPGGKADAILGLLGAEHQFVPIGIVDHRAELKGELLNGMKVYSPSELEEIVVQHEVKYLLNAGSRVPSYVQRFHGKHGQDLTLWRLANAPASGSLSYRPWVPRWVKVGEDAIDGETDRSNGSKGDASAGLAGFLASNEVKGP